MSGFKFGLSNKYAKYSQLQAQNTSNSKHFCDAKFKTRTKNIEYFCLLKNAKIQPPSNDKYPVVPFCSQAYLIRAGYGYDQSYHRNRCRVLFPRRPKEVTVDTQLKTAPRYRSK